MPVELWSRIVTASVAPVVLISASGLLCLAFYNRLAAVVTRLRGFHREQLQQQEALAKIEHSADNHRALVRGQEMLGMLQIQIDSVTRRARLIRLTLACLLLTIALLAGCSLALGLSLVFPAASIVAVALFVLGLLILIAGILSALLELRGAMDPVENEGKFVRYLASDLSNHDQEPVLGATPSTL